MDIRLKARVAGLGLAALALLAAAGQAAAAPINMPIVSGAQWKSSDAAPVGWQMPGFDDSAWANAYAPYPNPITTPADLANGPTSAQLMWHFTGPNPTGQNGPVEAWFRYNFTLAIAPDSLPLLGQALLLADDDFELYVNGQLVPFFGPTSLAARGENPVFADFSSMLANGDNVIAIHAVDNSLAAPGDLLFEWLYFDGRIHTVPEPGSCALILGGASWWLVRRRARRPAEGR